MKIIHLLLVAFLIFGFSISLHAQAERYTAQTVLDYVTGHSKNGSPDTKLTAVITINGSIPTPLGDINLNFTYADGKNLIWLYMFYSEAQQKHYLYGVSRVNAFGNAVNTAFDIDPALLNLDVESAPKLEVTTPILGSELIETRLKTNATYNAFKQEYPDSQPNFIILTRLDAEQLSEFTMLNGEVPYWVTQYVNSEDPNYLMQCFVNTKNEDVVCIRLKDITSVSEPKKSTEQLSVVPNPPSNSVAQIQFKQPVAGGTLRLYNTLGTIVKDLTPFVQNSTGSIPFSTLGLSSGMYLIQYQNGSESLTTTFVIQ
ncbi:MAG: T9SS type A sorting domain-containing protein [Candidatus Kapabacteria bacterium]|nr:T9SS type A sorting domain-containing protein [Candidatus Kapabacteria bacterium]